MHQAAVMMAFFALLTLAAAIGPIAWLVRARMAGTRQWLAAGAAASMSCAARLAGPWALLSVRLRPLVLVAMIAALIVAWYRASRAAASPNIPPRQA